MIHFNYITIIKFKLLIMVDRSGLRLTSLDNVKQLIINTLLESYSLGYWSYLY